jgi:hypothetical protein
MASLATGQSTTTQILVGTHIRRRWSPRFHLDTSEAMAIANVFSGGVGERIEGQLIVRKVGTMNAVKAAGTAALDTTSLTYEQDIEAGITVDPQFAYAAAAYTKPVMTRMLEFPEFMKAKREQFMRSLALVEDIDAGALFDDLATTVLGGGAATFTQDLFFQALGELRTQAAREFIPGDPSTLAYLRIHPKQLRYAFAIAAISQAHIRGDAANPMVTGRLNDALGVSIKFTGNVMSSGGAFHNCLFIADAFIRAMNLDAEFQDEQWNGLALQIIACKEYGVQEVYDNYAVDIQTTTA